MYCICSGYSKWCVVVSSSVKVVRSVYSAFVENESHGAQSFNVAEIASHKTRTNHAHDNRDMLLLYLTQLSTTQYKSTPHNTQYTDTYLLSKGVDGIGDRRLEAVRRANSVGEPCSMCSGGII